MKNKLHILIGLLLCVGAQAASFSDAESIQINFSKLGIVPETSPQERNEKIAVFLRDNSAGDLQINQMMESQVLSPFSSDDMKYIIRRSIELRNKNFIEKCFNQLLENKYWPIRLEMRELEELLSFSSAVAEQAAKPLPTAISKKINTILQQKVDFFQQINAQSANMHSLSINELVDLYQRARTAKSSSILKLKEKFNFGQLAKSTLEEFSSRPEAVEYIATHDVYFLLTDALEKYQVQLFSDEKMIELIYKCAMHNKVNIIKIILEKSEYVRRNISLARLMNAMNEHFETSLNFVQAMQARGLLQRLNSNEVWSVLESAAINNHKSLVDRILKGSPHNFLFPYVPDVNQLKAILKKVKDIHPYPKILPERMRQLIVAALNAEIEKIRPAKHVRFNGKDKVQEYDLSEVEEREKQECAQKIKSDMSKNKAAWRNGESLEHEVDMRDQNPDPKARMATVTRR